MNTKTFVLALLVCSISSVMSGHEHGSACPVDVNQAEQGAAKGVYALSVRDMEGNMVSLDQYKGKLTLIVNVASKCGLTPQYEALVKLHNEYKGGNFAILAFPANNFLNQEPGDNAEIKAFCSTNYGVEFPLFAKTSVKGDDIDPLYAFLTGEETNPGFAGEIEWNFTKFLVDGEGSVVARFAPRVTPDSEEFRAAIVKHIPKPTSCCAHH